MGRSDIIGRLQSNSKFTTVLRTAIRLIVQSLLRQKIILLPFNNPSDYIPTTKSDGIVGTGLMPERVRHMLALQYEQLDREVDWSRCTYKHNHRDKMVDNGIDTLARMGRYQLIGLSMCTSWDSLFDVEFDSIELLDQCVKRFTLGLYLTYFYLKSNDVSRVQKELFEEIDRVQNLRIYSMEYEVFAEKAKAKRSDTKRLLKNKYDRERRKKKKAQQATDGIIIGGTLDESVARLVDKYTESGVVDSAGLARGFGQVYLRTNLAPHKWPEKTILPELITSNWSSTRQHWGKAFALFQKIKKFKDQDNAFNDYAPFVWYLAVYLPIYFQYNPDSEALYPSRIEQFNGAQFVDHLDIGDTNKLPMSYCDFVKEYYHGRDPYRVYASILALKSFFESVLARGRDRLSIPDSFQNPVLESDIPSSGGRHQKTVKTRLPTEVYWLALLYSYKIYDYVSLINERCLDDYDYSMYFHALVAEGEDIMLDVGNIDGINFDTKITFQGVEYEVNRVPRYFFKSRYLHVKGRPQTYLIRPHAIAHHCIAFDTGIRHGHIQWLCCDFDKIVKQGEIIPEEVYRLFVKTDKSNKSWEATVAGRVIKVLREQKIFRDLINSEAFNKDIYYEDRSDEDIDVYKPFKAIFAFDPETGKPHSDGVYQAGFRYLLYGLQEVLDHYDVRYALYTYSDDLDEKSGGRVWKIKTDISPHSTRATVISEYFPYLGAHYIGTYMTGQKLATVHYYAKYDAAQLKKLQEEQKKSLARFSRDGASVNIGDGGEIIDATDKNSVLAKAFDEDPSQAIVDFGAISSNHFAERGVINGVEMLRTMTGLKLSLEPTHMCPYNGICPPDRRELGLEGRHHVCDYAIRTVDHLPAIASTKRTLSEQMDNKNNFKIGQKGRITDNEQSDVSARINLMGEDFASLHVAEIILNENLVALRTGKESVPRFHIYKPEAVQRDLEAVSFPDESDETKYLMARLKEAIAYPSPDHVVLNAKLMKLKKMIIANVGGIREALLADSNLNTVQAEVYSLVNSLARSRGLTLNQVAEIASQDISTLLGYDERPLLDSHARNFSGT